MSDDRTRPTRPIVFLILSLPFGVASGYVIITLGYLLAQAGVSVAAIAGLVAISFLPQTWKVLWAPIVDTTLNSKTWYLLAASITGLSLLATAFVPANNTSFVILECLVFANSVAVSLLAMAAENLMAHATPMEQKGRVAGWYQAGNLGGQGLGGGAGLWIAQHSGAPWLAGLALGLVCLVCCAALLFVTEPAQGRRAANYFASLWAVAKDVWATARSRAGLLAVLICFLPIGCGAASNLWSALASDWHASSDTVALVNGALSGLISALGCIVGGYVCDRIDRKTAYAIYGALLALAAIAMALAPRTELMFAVFTLLYAFIVGLSYAAFSAVVLEAIGQGAAATKYNLFASLSNMPIAYLTVVDGWARTRWNSGAMLFTEAAIGLIAIALFMVASTVSKSMVHAKSV